MATSATVSLASLVRHPLVAGTVRSKEANLARIGLDRFERSIVALGQCHFLPPGHRLIGTKNRNCQRPSLERDERQAIAHRGHQHVVGCAGERRLRQHHRTKRRRRSVGDFTVGPGHDPRLPLDVARQERAVPAADQCDLRLRRKLWPRESDVRRRAEGT